MSPDYHDRAARRRPTAVAALLLHLLVAALLPVVGSAHEVPDPTQPVHIEEEGGSPSCPRGHDDVQCLTCRLAATTLVPTTATRGTPAGGAPQHTGWRAIDLWPPALLQASPPSSRAPPAA